MCHLNMGGNIFDPGKRLVLWSLGEFYPAYVTLNYNFCYSFVPKGRTEIDLDSLSFHV